MSNIKIAMIPHPTQFDNHESGIKQVVLNYSRYLPQFGFEVVHQDSTSDLRVAHAGMTEKEMDISHLHGIYWSADYSVSRWEYEANRKIVEAVRHAKQITVPSEWVAETLRRDMRVSPHVVPHGVNMHEWEPEGHEHYVLWNKNRNQDVCDPTPMALLAKQKSEIEFMTTFMPLGWNEPLRNVRGTGGVVTHAQMRRLVKRSMVYLSTTKETFGIGILEAMAAAIPVLGFDWGGNRELVQHGINGYLAKPHDIDDLVKGLDYCIEHRDMLGANGREIAKTYTWEKSVEQVAGIYRLAMESDGTDRPKEIDESIYLEKV